jgi:hypothetical protein
MGVTPCRLAEVYWRFEETYCHHNQQREGGTVGKEEACVELEDEGNDCIISKQDSVTEVVCIFCEIQSECSNINNNDVSAGSATGQCDYYYYYY